MKGRVKLITAAILLAVTLVSGAAMANSGGGNNSGGNNFHVTVPLPTNLTGSNQYPIGSTATFQWFNDRGNKVKLDKYWVVGPLPSINWVSQGYILPRPIVAVGSSYAPINILLTWPGIAVGDKYVLHVKGYDLNGAGGITGSFDDTFTFKIVAAATPPSSGSHGISINPLLFFMWMASHTNNNRGNGTPSQPNPPTPPTPPTPPATQATGSVTATVKLDDAVTDAVVIAYKDGTQLIDILQGTAPAGTAYTAQTEHTQLGEVTGVANLELPVGDWNVIAMKACGDNYFWISEVKKLTVFSLFDIPTDLSLTTKIQLESQGS